MHALSQLPHILLGTADRRVVRRGGLRQEIKPAREVARAKLWVFRDRVEQLTQMFVPSQLRFSAFAREPPLLCGLVLSYLGGAPGSRDGVLKNVVLGVVIEGRGSLTTHASRKIEEVIDGHGARPREEHGERVLISRVARGRGEHPLEDALHDVILFKTTPSDERFVPL